MYVLYLQCSRFCLFVCLFVFFFFVSIKQADLMLLECIGSSYIFFQAVRRGGSSLHTDFKVFPSTCYITLISFRNLGVRKRSKKKKIVQL